MANVSFMAHGIKLWVNYVEHSYDDIEVKHIMVDGCNTDIEPLLDSTVIDLAYEACAIDIAEIDEYNKETAAEMRYYDDQPY